VTKGRDYLGPYRYCRLIRAGASCQVWEVARETDGKRLALKVLQPEQLKNTEEIEFLKHEYEVGKDLHHPNVIEVYEFNTDRGIPYLVLEVSNSKNLKIMLRNGVAPLEPWIPKIIDQSADGLRYMHSKGWIHRDIKPDNFLVSDEGDVKLIDFAIAQKPLTGFSKLFVRWNSVQGTRSYMSPEQIRNEVIDFRSDIYSYGCMLYELLTGKTPYTGVSADDLLAKHLKSPVPSPLVYNSLVTPDFNALVMRLMAKDRDDRPKSMEDFVKLLRSLRVFKSKPKS